jgi:hypothetical protein
MLRIISYIILFVLGARVIKKLFATSEPEKTINRDVEVKNSVEEKPLTEGQGEYIDYEEIKE